MIIIAFFCTVCHGVTVALFIAILYWGSLGEYADMHFISRKNAFSNFYMNLFFTSIGPYGSENFKTLLLSQILYEWFETFLEFSSPRSSQN